MRFVYFTLNKKHKEIDAVITYACVGIILVEISATSIFLGGVNMKNNNLDARFKCHMDTDINHYKANFINIAIKKTLFLRQKTAKQVFQNDLNEKILPMFDDHPFVCLGLLKAFSIDFVWELK